MREPNKGIYTRIALDLIYFSMMVEETWARCDLKHLNELIEIIRYYRQFTKE